MTACPSCGTRTNEEFCPSCNTQILSEPADTMDEMIEKASIPNLAALFQKGQDAGLIKPTQEYSPAN